MVDMTDPAIEALAMHLLTGVGRAPRPRTAEEAEAGWVNQPFLVKQHYREQAVYLLKVVDEARIVEEPCSPCGHGRDVHVEGIGPCGECECDEWWKVK